MIIESLLIVNPKICNPTRAANGFVLPGSLSRNETLDSVKTGLLEDNVCYTALCDVLADKNQTSW